MTAPSNANTSGLVNVGHIVWWKAGGVSYYPEGEAFGVSKSCRVEPLVTAASAQAAIDAEVASLSEAVRRAEINEAIWSDLADEYKARAERLTRSLEYIASLNCGYGPPETENENNLGICVAELQREALAALQQETQP